MKISTIAVALAACLAAAAAPARAQIMIDQQNLADATLHYVSCGTSGGSISQGFVPSVSPLVGVDLMLLSTGPAHTVRIREGAVDGPILGQVSAALVPGWVHFDFSAQPIAVTPGNLYVIEFVSAATMAENWSDSYAGGDAYGCTNNDVPQYDIVFRTYWSGPLPVRSATWGVVKSFYRD